MRKLTLLIILATILQACGFQQRKYTIGHYGDFHRDLESIADVTKKTDISAQSNDSIIFICAKQALTIEAPRKSYQLPMTSNNIPDVPEDKRQILAVTAQKINTLPVDTLKLRFHHKKKDKSELKPPHDVLKLRNKRRVDALLSVLSFVAAILFLLAAQYHSDAFWGLLGTSLINIWMVCRMHRDFRQMKKLMRSIFCENQDKKWFLRQEKRNGLAVVFTPFYLAMLIFSLMLFTIGIFIGFSLF